MINPTRVTEIFMDSMFKAEELRPDGSGVKEGFEIAVANGVQCNVGFNKARLETYREEVIAMLAQLPLQFRSDKGLAGAGGGWSFLEMCALATGEQWTGMQWICEQLIQLGMGLKVADKMPLPAQFLPGGVPYFFINLTGPLNEYKEGV